MGSKVQVSPGERQAADLAEEQYQDYKQRFVPLEKAFEGQLDRIRDDRTRATGSAAADTLQAFDPAIQQVQQQGMAAGVNPNSGKSAMTLADLMSTRGEAMGGAMMNADQATEDRYYAGQDQLIGIGQGQASSANTGFMQSARYSAQDARAKARASALEKNTNWQMAGTVIGMAARGGMNKIEAANAPGTRNSGHGVMGAGKPWNDRTSRPSTLN